MSQSPSRSHDTKAMIPADRALVGWSFDKDTNMIGKVIVFSASPVQKAAAGGSHAAQWHGVAFVTRACGGESPCGRQRHTPEAVFKEMLAGEGFATPQDAANALREFAKIEGCGWAGAVGMEVRDSEHVTGESWARRIARRLLHAGKGIAS